ncbi:hypothetical protein M431DRAFT_504107 [Trichoderma harzianum CBS 226.95]|uniref:Uncharacterized protein n=1 Tax=Trichoderma harzianum CBS 226.95 TaxID=983964 RepID=A0A2T4AQD6_TRIHA|nr:hypothetical protein M431DRAFT_504107 [Trichoderma harzianum CBS 226.95]PTB59148.1 hypothetical protein M431DRAFT_504107 [Trichoderma harzianum CBS 226.95]
MDGVEAGYGDLPQPLGGSKSALEMTQFKGPFNSTLSQVVFPLAITALPVPRLV